VDQTLGIANDELDGGSGNDFLVGDDMTVSAPSLAVPVGLVHSLHSLVDAMEDFLKDDSSDFDQSLFQVPIKTWNQFTAELMRCSLQKDGGENKQVFQIRGDVDKG
jgi:hypothetical protein